MPKGGSAACCLAPLFLLLAFSLANCRSLHGIEAAASASGQAARAGLAPPCVTANANRSPSPPIAEPPWLSAGTSAALLLAPLIAGLSNAAGVGGGAVFVPLFSVLLSMTTKAATALSQSAIAGGAFGAVCCCISRRHPQHPAAPLIDYDLALVLLPPVLVGAGAGVLINLALPSWILTCLLIPVLLLFTIRTACKGLQLRHAEEREQAQQQQYQAATCPGSGESAPALNVAQQQREQLPAVLPAAKLAAAVELGRLGAHGAGRKCTTLPATASACGQPSVSAVDADVGMLTWRIAAATPIQQEQEVHVQPRQQEREQHQPCTAALISAVPQSSDHSSKALDATSSAGGVDLEQQQGLDPAGGNGLEWCWLQKLGQMALLWLAFLALQVGKDHYGRCTWQYGLLFGAQAALTLSMAALFNLRSLRCQQGRLPSTHSEAEPILLGGLRSDSAAVSPCTVGAAAAPLTARQLVAASAISLVGGVVAGMLGFGGGMVMAPLLLELGAHPSAAAATSGLMVLFSASTAVLAFAAAGSLNLAYAAVFGTSCMAAALLGTLLIGRAVRRSGRASTLVLLLAAVMGLGAVATTAFSGRRAVLDVWHGTHLGMPPFCN